MADRLHKLVSELSQKTKEGKIFWSLGFDDDQFLATVPPTSAAFVVQSRGNEHRLRVLDEMQVTILDQQITKAEYDDVLGSLAPVSSEPPQPEQIPANPPFYSGIEKAEKLLATI